MNDLFAINLIKTVKYYLTNLRYHLIVTTDLGVAPAGARVPLRGPMTRGDYGEFSMIQLQHFDYYQYRKRRTANPFWRNHRYS